MDIEYGKRLFHTFVRVFIVLFVILVVMPWVLDMIMHSLCGGMPPGSNSIKVFKDFIAEKAAASSFFDALRKLIIFM